MEKIYRYFSFRSKRYLKSKEISFRNSPTSFFLRNKFNLQNDVLQNDQIYWPIFYDNTKRCFKIEIVIIGGMY